MAFWGVEVKPGNPISHPPDNGRGRLHISQATLGIYRGIGASERNSVVQCNVGNKRPVLLCSLYPGSSESRQLHVEFDEVDQVIFSVIGPRSVHLTGYYLGGGPRRIMDDESESYGEDIQDTETDSSDDDDDDDEYEDSFIDDTDEILNTSSPASSDGVEEISEKRMHNSERSSLRRLRKRYQHIESDDDSVSVKQQMTHSDGSSSGNGMDTDAEDACLISSLVKPKPSAKRTQQKAKKENCKASEAKAAKDDVNSLPLPERKSVAAIDSEPKCQKEKVNLHSDAKLEKSETQSKDTNIVDDFFFGYSLSLNKTKKNETNGELFGQSFPNSSEVIEKKADIEKEVDSKQKSKPKKKKKQRTEEKATEVSSDFASPENVGECIRLKEELSRLPPNYPFKEDKLEVKKMYLHAMKSAMENLEKVGKKGKITKTANNKASGGKRKTGRKAGEGGRKKRKW